MDENETNKPEAVPELEPGTLIAERFEIKKPLAAGGMSLIYRAHDRRLSIDVALKTIAAIQGHDVKRYIREAQCLAKVKSAHVVHVYDAGEFSGRPYVALELLEGQDLGEILQPRKKLRIDRACDIVCGSAKGLFACHAGGEFIFHRDIKPANIFLSVWGNEETVKILDFGISVFPFAPEITSLNNRPGEAPNIAGTLAYMSPEQIGGRSVEAASDQYSLAVVLYRAITGRLPYDASDKATYAKCIATGRIVPPSAFLSSIPKGLETAILKALSFDPTDRFEDVREFALALREFAGPVGNALFTVHRAAGGRVSEAYAHDESFPHGRGSAGDHEPVGTIIDSIVKLEPGVYVAGGTVRVGAHDPDATVREIPRLKREAVMSQSAPAPVRPLPEPAKPPARVAEETGSGGVESPGSGRGSRRRVVLSALAGTVALGALAVVVVARGSDTSARQPSPQQPVVAGPAVVHERVAAPDASPLVGNAAAGASKTPPVATGRDVAAAANVPSPPVAAPSQASTPASASSDVRPPKHHRRVLEPKLERTKKGAPILE